MTAAQIKTAAALLDREQVQPGEIVSLSEIGSEGAVLRIGPRVPGSRLFDGTWLIARDGTAQSRNGEWYASA